MNRRYIYLVMAVLAVAAAAIAVVAVLPSEQERLVEQAVAALNAGDIEAADRALQRLGERTHDSVDVTGIMSLRVALAVAAVVRDNLLATEYDGMAIQFDESDPVHAAYKALGEEYRTRYEEQRKNLESIARTYQGQHYQPGLRLQSPLRGELRLSGDDGIIDAYLDLLNGEAEEKDHAALYKSAAREAAGGVLRRVIVQPEAAAEDTVALSGSLDLAELWWLIGSNVPSPLFSEASIDTVLEETKNTPDHPARQRALDALRYFGRVQ